MLNNFNLYARYKTNNTKIYSNWVSAELYQKDIVIQFLNSKKNKFNYNHPLYGNIEIELKEISNNNNYIYEYIIKNSCIVQLQFIKTS